MDSLQALIPAGFQKTVDSFEWRTGVTPLSDLTTVIASSVAYVVIVLALQAVLKSPVPLGKLPSLHNLILCLWSLAMFVVMLYETYKESVRSQSSQWLLCLPPGTQARGGLYFWSYMYYISKYYELLDTVVLVLKKKPLIFLHVFHHAGVLIMSYAWLEHVQSLQVIALLTNTGIHVIMYWYYFLCSVGIYPKWKVLVTNGQIIQFVFSFLASIPFVYLHFAKPTSAPAGCSGFNAWLFNAGFNGALLLLFINFHRQQYRNKKKTRKEE